MSSLNWKGDEVVANVIDAAKYAVDETLAACVLHAKTNHPWTNRTGTLEGSIQMRPAEVESSGVRGQWGSFTVDYALFLEIETANSPAFPYLRPAADAEYPKLAQRIRDRLASS